MSASTRVTVWYDSDCPLCVRAIRLMRRLDIDLGTVAETALYLADQGKSPLYVAIDGKLAALLAVADPLKTGSESAIKALRELGMQAAMLTGDNRRTAKSIAQEVGIERVLAEVLPEQKARALASPSSAPSSC